MCRCFNPINKSILNCYKEYHNTNIQIAPVVVMTIMLVAYFRVTRGPAMFTNMDGEEVKNLTETQGQTMSMFLI
jgi:hypothetical protein